MHYPLPFPKSIEQEKLKKKKKINRKVTSKSCYGTGNKQTNPSIKSFETFNFILFLKISTENMVKLIRAQPVLYMSNLVYLVNDNSERAEQSIFWMRSQKLAHHKTTMTSP